MEVDSINPFIESVDELFSRMLNAKLQRGNIAVSQEPSKSCEITAIVGMSGFFCGSVALAFSTKTAITVINRLLDTDIRIVDESITDGIAEFVNIVAGAAKVKFIIPEGGKPIDLTLPVIIRGRDYSVSHSRKSTWLEVPFESELGGFHLRVTLEGKMSKES